MPDAIDVLCADFVYSGTPIYPKIGDTVYLPKLEILCKFDPQPCVSCALFSCKVKGSNISQREWNEVCRSIPPNSSFCGLTLISGKDD